MKPKHLVALVAAILLFATPAALESCLPPEPTPVFATRSGPADPKGEFFQGKIGVIVPSFRNSYLIAAYRYLSGRNLSAAEVNAFLAQAPQPQSYLPPGVLAWQQARKTFPGASQDPYFLIGYKSRNGTGYMAFYQNCLDNALVTASSTLQDRASRWGADSPNVREWLTAQDQVFQNCGGNTSTIPAEPTPNMDPLLAADREYQIAAAHFYAGDWEQARRAFQRVAQNANSPWRDIAPYLLARTYLREGLIDEEQKPLEEAERRFKAIVDDPSQQKWHGASSGLLDFTGARIHASERLQQYAAELSGEGPGARPSQNPEGHLRDFLLLYDHDKDKSGLAATSDVVDWLLALRNAPADSGAHVLDRWRKSHNHAWLIAALSWASALRDADVSELVQAAREIKPDDPAYESAVYYGVDAEVKRGHRDEARQWADQALNGKLLLSSRNRMLFERMKLAQNWNDFLRFAPRRPEPHLTLYDDEQADDDGNWVKVGDLFDADATAVLNRDVPLMLLSDGARNPRLPKQLQMILAQRGFARALILGRLAQMREFMQRIVELNPADAGIAQEILTTADAPAARFAGVMLLLRTSAPKAIFDPASPPSDFHRAHSPGSIYWGFSQTPAQTDPRNVPVDLSFQSRRSTKAQADLEWNALEERADCGATFAENEALQWAVKHPEDKRVPEALYLVVQTTYLGCRGYDDGHVGKNSHQAFDLLHKRYPNSEWTKKTKYWYN